MALLTGKAAIRHTVWALALLVAASTLLACGGQSEAERHNNKGIDFLEAGLPDEAIAELDRTIELNPKFALPYSNRAYAYNAKGEYDRAIADASKAIDLNPKLAVAYNNRAEAYSDKGQRELAIQDY